VSIPVLRKPQLILVQIRIRHFIWKRIKIWPVILMWSGYIHSHGIAKVSTPKLFRIIVL
jgi:hypothetical protein